MSSSGVFVPSATPAAGLVTGIVAIASTSCRWTLQIVAPPPANTGGVQNGSAGDTDDPPGSAMSASESFAGVGNPPVVNGPRGAFQYRLCRSVTVPAGAVPAVNGWVVPVLAQMLFTTWKSEPAITAPVPMPNAGPGNGP